MVLILLSWCVLPEASVLIGQGIHTSIELQSEEVILVSWLSEYYQENNNHSTFAVGMTCFHVKVGRCN